ncbi:MFS transporter [Arthrobacter sp. MYb211]|uniref:MFS transporter n=1 Tax=Micrococcaceae TaxID=1268 RepID=UPI000CFA9C9E|nr:MULTISPECIES: MFS transporter [unclassified Arthrobacter]PRA00485.1 MFS transporter [Arthrobacter sp. MYb224]PRA04677.1 MFS transporter [Arthrobacter sp. MYb229]PRA10645.1 MFS transporter [Arthrobacter sp. MYb221]PRB51409.1 MFS transporter [Arthrobacter sp. MYb216]PRC06338.1 MFS transporter [Arthrobacter sp. MYb211]
MITERNSRLPEALRVPTKRVGAGWIAAVVIVHIGINVGFFAPIQVLLGLHAEQLDASQKNAILSLVTGVGAAVSLVANPLFGALSDRSTSKFGRRVPWVMCGTVFAALALLLMSTAQTVTMLVIGWALMQAAGNAALAAIFAAIPDKVPVEQRGLVGGLVALGQTCGSLIGAVIGMVAASNLVFGYAMVATAVAICAIPFVLMRQDVPLPKGTLEPLKLLEFIKSFWINPLQYTDFGWAWLTRFLLYLGSQLCLVYLLFFLQDELHHPEPATGVLVLTAIYAFCVIFSSVISGRLSDRDGKRKKYVIISSVIVAIAALTLAFASSFGTAIIAAVLLGIGFGAYLAVDFALLTQVLPHEDSRGKDLGMINIANSLPQVVAPLVAWLSVTWFGGYSTLFICSAVISLVGAVLVTKIKSVP